MDPAALCPRPPVVRRQEGSADERRVQRHLHPVLGWVRTRGDRCGPQAAGRWFTEPCDEAGTALSWRIEAKLHEERSEYQQIAIYQTTHFGRLMVIDGFVMVTTRDNFFYHEMLVHPAMFMHPDPQRVVVIGGGDCGTLQQVLRHPGVTRAHQIEIDQRVTDLAIEHFPSSPSVATIRGPSSPSRTGSPGCPRRARLGRRHHRRFHRSDRPAVGLYEVPFLRSCYEALGPDGILVQQSGSPFLHLDTELRPLVRATQGAGFSAVSPLCFPQPCYAAGWWSCTLASKRDSNDAFRERDAAQRPFSHPLLQRGDPPRRAGDPAILRVRILIAVTPAGRPRHGRAPGHVGDGRRPLVSVGRRVSAQGKSQPAPTGVSSSQRTSTAVPAGTGIPSRRSITSSRLDPSVTHCADMSSIPVGVDAS